MADRERLKRRRRRRIAAAGGVVVIGTAAGLAISGAVASGQTSYVTALVNSAPVSKTLSMIGTVQPADKATAAFQIAGTVSAVGVSTGQTVTAGQQLATLTSTALQENVSSAQSSLAAANAKLTEDESNQSSSTSGQAQTTAAVTESGAQVVLAAAVTASPLAADQQALVKSQHTADMDMQSAAADLTQVQSTCTSSSGTSSSGTSPSGTSSSGSSPPTTSPSQGGSTGDSTSTTSTSTSTTTTPSSNSSGSASGSDADSACAATLTQAAAAEAQVQTDQQAVATAETRLAEALASAAQSGGGSSTSHTGTGPGSGSGSGSKSTSNSSSGSSIPKSSGASTPVNTDTPQQLATDQAGIDSAEAVLVEAQQSLSDAVLVAPISGTVVSVALTPGQSVSSGSSTDAVTIISSGVYVAQATLTTSQVAEVAQGDKAQVEVNGMNGVFLATVTRVGPVTESNGSYVYPMVAALDSSGGNIPSGSDSQITVDLASASETMVVPTSAVHTTATESYVLLDKNGNEVEQRVTVGVVGSVHTQITSGLTTGQSVILANPSEALPSSSTNQTNTRLGVLGGAGGFVFRGGGGGLGGAGGGFGGGTFGGGGTSVTRGGGG